MIIYKDFVVEIDSRGYVTMTVSTLFEIIDTCSEGDDKQVTSLKESLFDVFERTSNQKNIS